jgi:hypothetical protein
MSKNTIIVLIYHCRKLLDLVRLRVFENRVPRRLFGPKRDVVTGGWRNLHN